MTYFVSNTNIITNNQTLVGSGFTTTGAQTQIEIFSYPNAVGEVAGYTSGGLDTNVIDKFPFASDANASDVGDLSVLRFETAGQSSSVSGYASGGQTPAPVTQNVIDRFPFASNANATDVGDVTSARRRFSGQSSITHGFASGGIITPGSFINTIDRFPFASNANASDVGDLTDTQADGAGASSVTSGYVASGLTAPPVGNVGVNTIQKFPFASNTNATDVGDLTQQKLGIAGQSSTTHGYIAGGSAGASPPFSATNVIEKYPFASNANASDVGDLTAAKSSNMGQSSTSSGYTTGGSPYLNVIEKFPFSTDTNATDVGDLTQGRQQGTGQQD